MDKKIKELKNLVDTAEIALQQARDILAKLVGDESDAVTLTKGKHLKHEVKGEEKIIEGVFDGQQMIGPDSKQYSVPANYASKSKLVEGDILKLTILPDGSFVYKQIAPQERERHKGQLVHDNETDGFRVVLPGGKSYKVLIASVTYFKGQPGDEVIILLPKAAESTWAAIENVVKKEEDQDAGAASESEDQKQEDSLLEKVDLSSSDASNFEEL